MAFKTLDDLKDISGKTVLVRVDINVPVKDGQVTDTTRIERVEPTILELSDNGAKVVLLAHFGRPKGKVVEEMSLRPVAQAMEEILDRRVFFASLDDAAGAIGKMMAGDILLLENTRFEAGEEKNDDALADRYAALGDVYVNDAFSAAHRAHASTEALAKRLPAYAGRSMEAELKALEAALGDPKRPVVAIVGGSKVSTKIDLLENLVGRVDALVIGGGMANTFLLARGVDVKASLAEPDLANKAREIEAAAEASGCTIVLPGDAVTAEKLEADTKTRTVSIDAVPEGQMILDVGPKTVEAVERWIDDAATLVWNGPLGAFEFPPFDRATVAAAQFAAQQTKAGDLVSIAGGGDTVAALNHAGVGGDFTYVSTAGGAFLEWMEGKALPGVEALEA